MRIIKYGAFILLTLVSMYLSVNMFVQLGADILGSLILGAVALALESTKVFSLLRIEFSVYSNLSLKSIFPSIAIYISLALLSIVASLGFTLVTVDKQVESSKIEFTTSQDEFSFEIEQLQTSIALIDSQINALQEQMSRINPDFATGSVRLSTEAASLSEKRLALISEISKLKQLQRSSLAKTLEGDTANVYGMFTLMGEFIGLRDKQVMGLLLLLVSVLIELGMIYTSPTIQIKSEETHEVVKAQPPPREPKPALIERKPRRRNINIKDATKIAIKLHSPEVTTSVEEKIPIRTVSKINWRELLPKILHPERGSELKTVTDLSKELGIPYNQLENLFNRLATIKGLGDIPLISKHETDRWHLNYVKDMVVKLALSNLGKKV